MVRFSGLRLVNCTAGLAVAMGAVATAALAGPLPDATGSGFVAIQGPYQTFDNVTAPFHFGVPVLGSTGIAITDAAPTGPAVIAAADNGVASITFTWSYQVNGPDGQTVPLDLTGALSVSGYEYNTQYHLYSGLSKAYVLGTAPTAIPTQIYDGGIKVYAEDCLGGAGGTCTNVVNTDGAFDLVLNVPTNTPETVTIRAYADSLQGGPQTGPFTASADPILQIDPGVVDPGAYSIQVSDGIYNGTQGAAGAPGVPEPAAWALMILGFGATGAVLRQRRSLAAA